MKILHIIRREEDNIIHEFIDHDRTVGDVSVLLIQDGVLSRFDSNGGVFASINDVRARGINVQYKLIDYPSMCQLIVEHDKVVVW